MAYRRRPVRPIRRRRRNVATRHPLMKAVAKRVVKTALSRQIERKRLTFSFADLSLGGHTYYYRNILSSIVQGQTESTRIGDKVNDLRLNMSLTWAFTGRTSTGTLITTGAPLRVMLIKTRKQLSTVGNAYQSYPASAAGDFPQLLANPFHLVSAPVNTHDYTVLYDKLVYSSLGMSESPYPRGNTVVHRFSVPLAKQFRFSDTDPFFGKYSNIYLVIGTSYLGSDPSHYAGNVQSSGFLTWHDA